MDPYHNKKQLLVTLAKKYEYTNVIDQPDNLMISFLKKGIRVNVYYSTMTVGTCLTHPKRGKTQLFRRNCTMEEVNMLMENPRKHTQKGYYLKKQHVG